MKKTHILPVIVMLLLASTQSFAQCMGDPGVTFDSTKCDPDYPEMLEGQKAGAEGGMALLSESTVVQPISATNSAGLNTAILQPEGRSFEEILNKKKELVFLDSCTGDWAKRWVLDGKEAKVENFDAGMDFIAGPKFGNDTSHAVLWTKEQFKGNIIIEYEYTRTDTAKRAVNILYFLATGKNTNGYHKDILKWNDRRTVPHMRTYFNNMNTYHVSYAAFDLDNDDPENDYIRMRRYMPLKNNGLNNTNIEGEYFNTGLFNTGETFKITVVKYNEKVWMNIESMTDPAKKLLCEWDTSEYPDLTKGRIGLRHMYTRSARYKNFKVWEVQD